MLGARKSRVNLFGYEVARAAQEFSQTVSATAGWILSHSSSSRVFSLRSETLQFQIFIHFSGTGKTAKAAAQSQGCWPLYNHWGHNGWSFFFLLEWPVFVLLTVKWVGAVTPRGRGLSGLASALRFLLVLRENRGRDESNSILCATLLIPSLYL